LCLRAPQDVIDCLGAEDQERLGSVLGLDVESSLVAVLRELTGGRGVDVILDMVGGDYLPREIDCLADDGRLALIATLGGGKGTLDLGQLLRRRLTVTGSTLRPRSVAFKAAIAKQLQQRVWPMFEAGKVKPVIYEVFPLDHAASAHALMEGGAHVGKIMLQVI